MHLYNIPNDTFACNGVVHYSRNFTVHLASICIAIIILIEQLFAFYWTICFLLDYWLLNELQWTQYKTLRVVRIYDLCAVVLHYPLYFVYFMIFCPTSTANNLLTIQNAAVWVTNIYYWYWFLSNLSVYIAVVWPCYAIIITRRCK